MSAPTSNNLEGFIPDEKHTPVHIRHRIVGTPRSSNPELKDIFDHPTDFVAEDTVSPEQAFNELDKALNAETFETPRQPTIASEIKVRPGTALDRSLHIPKKPENTMEVPNNDQLLSFFDNKNRKSLKETRFERERGRGQGPQQEENPPTVFQKTKNQISDFANVLLRNKQGEEKSKILAFRTELSSVPESNGLEGFTEIIQKGLRDQIISPTQADFLLEQLSREKVVEEKISVKESRNEPLPWSNEGGKLFYYLGSKSNSTSEQGKAFKNLQFAIDHLQTAEEVRSVLITYKDKIGEDEFKKISVMVGASEEREYGIKPTTITMSEAELDRLNQSRPRPITEIPPAIVSEIKPQVQVEPMQKVEATPPPLPRDYLEAERTKKLEQVKQKNVEKVWSAIERVEAWSPGHTFTINALGKRVSLVEGLTPEECQAAFRELARQGKLVASGNEYRVKMMESEDDEGIVAPAAEGEKETPEVTGTQEMPIFKPESAEASPGEVTKVWDSIKSRKYVSPFITRPDGPHSSVVGVPSNEVVQAAFEELVKQGKLQPTSSRGMYSVIQNNPVPFEPALMASEEAVEDFKPLTSDADREAGFKREILDKIDEQVASKATVAKVQEPTNDQRNGWDELEGQMDKNVAENAFLQMMEDHKKPPEGSLEAALRGRMETARDAHFDATMAHKKSQAEKKGAFKKMMSKLGAGDKQMPVNENDQTFVNLKQTEEAHFKAKAELRMNMLGRDEIGPVTKAEDERINKKQVEEREKQDAIWKKKLMEATPVKERGRLAQTFKDWNDLPIWARTTLSVALLSGLDAAAKQLDIHVPGFGNHAVTLGSAGYRLVRASVGAGVSKVTGNYVDSIQRKGIEKRKEKATAEYLDAHQKGVNMEAFIQQEREYQEYLAKEAGIQNKNRIYKALAMAGAGAGVTTGLGVGMQEVSGLIDHAHGAVPAEVPSIDHTSHVSAPEVKVPVHAVLPEAHATSVSVQLSPKGFIQTFVDLKAQIAERYHDVATAPPEAQHILNTSPEKLAEEYGLYKPGETFQSAIGLKGEHLSLDTKGDLVLERHGGDQTLFDASTERVSAYKGAMLDANTGDIENTHVLGSQHPIPHQAPPQIVPEQPHVDAPTISEEIVLPANMTLENAIAGRAPLDAKYQFDPAYKKVRTAYNIQFEKLLANRSFDDFTNILPISYKGGLIQVIQKGDEVIGLLNGEKIGTGKLIDGGVGWKYEDTLGKGGLFGVKSPYEEAFEKMKQVVDKKKDIFTTARV